MPAIKNSAHTARIYIISETVFSAPSKQSAMKIGTAERIQRTAPSIFMRENFVSKFFFFSLTMPQTPYSVSKGSFPRKSYAFTLAPQERKTAAPTATSKRSTESPMPAAAPSEIYFPESASPAMMRRTIGDIIQRKVANAIFGAAAQLGIFAVLLVSILMGFTPREAASLGIIGGADGPTAIFTTIKLAPHLLGPIAIAAYSYMALVPVIVPLVVRLWCTKKELSINMKEQEKKYPSKTEIKNLRVLKIIFPIACTTIVALFVPSAVPLIGMLMFGNLVKEIGSNTSRLFDAASNSIMNAATIFLGISVGATMTTDAFLNWTTIGIVIGGFLAFALSISGGIFFVKIFNLFTKKKINPLIGATGLSAVPMASRVANEIALKYDPKNHVLQYCMASNISGVIGSAVAAGVLISFLG